MSDTSFSPSVKNDFIRALVYGPPGSLKTASSPTMSIHCPPEWTHLRLTSVPSRGHVELSDMHWLSFDAQATLGFRQLNVSVPSTDFSLVPSKDLFSEMDKAVKEVALKAKESPTPLTIVVDTVSKLDAAMTSALTDMGLVNADDTRSLYRELAQRHFKFHKALTAIPANILFLSHAKSAQEVVSTSSKPTETLNAAIAAKKKDAAGTGEITAEITGKSLNLYRGDSSFVFNCRRAKRMENGKAVDGFWFYTNDGSARYDSKSRLILPDVIPADWRVVKQIAFGTQIPSEAA